MPVCELVFFFFFNDTATTEIYTLSLHDALPIFRAVGVKEVEVKRITGREGSTDFVRCVVPGDRKSTRLNSSHSQISYAVFCLKKKKIAPTHHVASPTHDARSPTPSAPCYASAAS